MDTPVNYLVAYDFTPEADAAVSHGLTIANRNNGAVQLLHLVKNEKAIKDAEDRLNKVIADLGLNDGDPAIEAHVVVGNIFEDISKIADYSHAKMVIMGTHGAKGFQKITGSHAMKVITSSSVPFVVCQHDHSHDTYNKIVIPVNLTKESIRVMQFAVEVAKMFDSEVHIVGSKQNDEWLDNKISNNIVNVRKYMAENGVKSEVAILDGKAAYVNEVLEYGHNIGAELYALAYFSESLLPQFDTFAQNLITNSENVPVLIINAEEVGVVNSQYSFITI